MSKRGNIFKLSAMLTIGTLIGAIIALLFAPKSGKETRTQIKNSSLNTVNKLKSARNKTQENLNLIQVSNWGNYPKVKVKFLEFEDIDTLRQHVLNSQNVIARGNGRCYGDSALAPEVISTLRYNKFVSFNKETGVLKCQAGVILSDILAVVVPQGWFLSVVPGTKLISTGGAVASNVHGKSQHNAGNFCDHVLEIELMLGDGAIITCSPQENSDLYWTTCGGMGLTGVIVSVTIQLIPVETAYFKQESIRAKNLDHLMDLFEQSEDWSYSVAWIDCLVRGKSMGRGFIVRGDHATLADLTNPVQVNNPLGYKSDKKLNIPITFPSFVLNSLSMRIFNMLIYFKHPNKVVKSIESYDSFFFPLDFINNWNKLYGKKGFTQYQFILPKENSRAGMQKIIKKISHSKIVSNLGVLKLYKQQNGFLPFAIDGYALALDFPIRDGLFEFLDELDEIVLSYGGRLYLTKDVRMKKDMFMQSYPNVETFIDNVKEINHETKFRSFQSDRVGITL